MKHFNFVAANFSLNHCRNACEAHREACLAFAEGFALKRKTSCMKRIGKKKGAKAVKAKASFFLLRNTSISYDTNLLVNSHSSICYCSRGSMIFAFAQNFQRSKRMRRHIIF